VLRICEGVQNDLEAQGSEYTAPPETKPPQKRSKVMDRMLWAFLCLAMVCLFGIVASHATLLLREIEPLAPSWDVGKQNDTAAVVVPGGSGASTLAAGK